MVNTPSNRHQFPGSRPTKAQQITKYSPHAIFGSFLRIFGQNEPRNVRYYYR